ncbi:MAG: aminomethyltransferase family protein [Phycisphaerales bacterium]|nr:MAG: aminomethyltransferase family protein [Phycisphaerales bacterium]
MMVNDTPLRKRHESYVQALQDRGTDDETASARPGAARGRRAELGEMVYLAYGPAAGPEETATHLVATFGEVEAEYAAVRRATGILDSPHRGLLQVTGSDRIDFLDRMLTQDVGNMAAGSAAESFLLNRKGRIEADLLLIELGDRMLIEVDHCQAKHVRRTLEEYVIAENLRIADVSGEHYQIALHGPKAMDVLGNAAEGECAELKPLEATTVKIDGVDVAIARRDQVGDAGLCLIMPRDKAEAVWDALLATDEVVGEGKRRVRPVGWYAFNTARIEAGTPLYNIDFGNTNLPHETGVLHGRVSLAKRCYIGQEIVARTESRGRPRQVLAGLRIAGEAVPMAGEAVFEKRSEYETGDHIGVVTSSTPAPMLGSVPIALAMLKTAAAEVGTSVLVYAEGAIVSAVVQKPAFRPVRSQH